MLQAVLGAVGELKLEQLLSVAEAEELIRDLQRVLVLVHKSKIGVEYASIGVIATLRGVTKTTTGWQPGARRMKIARPAVRYPGRWQGAGALPCRMRRKGHCGRVGAEDERPVCGQRETDPQAIQYRRQHTTTRMSLEDCSSRCAVWTRKSFLSATRPSRAGEWIWSTKGVRKVLFRLPDLIDAVLGGQTVFVCEGEKDCLAMANVGLCATCNPGGADKLGPKPGGSKSGLRHTQSFSGRRCGRHCRQRCGWAQTRPESGQ